MRTAMNRLLLASVVVLLSGCRGAKPPDSSPDPSPQVAPAAQAGAGNPETDRRVADLERRVAELERHLAERRPAGQPAERETPDAARTRDADEREAHARARDAEEREANARREQPAREREESARREHPERDNPPAGPHDPPEPRTRDDRVNTAQGTTTGEVTALGDAWIEVRSGSGHVARYIPDWRGGNPDQGGGPDREVVGQIGALKVGDRVTVHWHVNDHIRVERLEKVR